MKVVKTGNMKDGTAIQIEDWSEDYSFHNKADVLASYPKSKMTHEGTYAPKAGERYRFSFWLGSAGETESAFNVLTEGRKTLSDFKKYMHGKLEYQDCI
ncbi:hypothetical protein [Paenibacillus polymyxa]|uniref:Uncharacterized protein n=1 Tax=Paenibacillus polymyxa (strain SC2) TaxID=886882 RepID=E3EL77_PAEPS|nr:hypothetical protein [Paenibacillus polymyxa]ADO59909.1 hypothetical protein PPSC2_28620 [Paenibacillus polymyxa SC2]WPQ59867.1 hypothetical protein SKN87_26635 [Paenibacillus polymyxa]